MLAVDDVGPWLISISSSQFLYRVYHQKTSSDDKVSAAGLHHQLSTALFITRHSLTCSRITKMAKQPPVCLYIIEYYIQSLAFLYARNSSQQVKTAEQIAKPQFI